MEAVALKLHARAEPGKAFGGVNNVEIGLTCINIQGKT
jgi:hypothetical protein